MRRLLLMVLFAGCAPTTYAYTPSSNKPVSPKPDNCAFEVLTTPPTDFEELGMLQHYNGDIPKDTAKLKSAVQNQVCGTGGDAVVAIADNQGRFVKGQVIKFVRPSVELVKPPAPPEGSASGSAAGSAAKKK